MTGWKKREREEEEDGEDEEDEEDDEARLGRNRIHTGIKDHNRSEQELEG